MPDARLDLILHQLDDLPTLPAVAVRVLDATGRDDTEANDVTRLLESDPALSARILKLVHRADLAARGGNAETVARAVALLGFDAVPVRHAGRGRLPNPRRHRDLGRHQPDAPPTTRRSTGPRSGSTPLAVACCGELLATRLQVRDMAAVDGVRMPGCSTTSARSPSTRLLPKSFNRVVEAVDLLRGNIADLERSVIGIDHLTAGKHLCRALAVAGHAFAEVAWLHGQSPAALPKRTCTTAATGQPDLAGRPARPRAAPRLQRQPRPDGQGRPCSLAAVRLTPARRRGRRSPALVPPHGAAGRRASGSERRRAPTSCTGRP